ncbi:MAG: hypothetical protein LE168_01260 [Endomicrobium sp.]|nr:hypothetical protein [Endomicrobium sp.]
MKKQKKHIAVLLLSIMLSSCSKDNKNNVSAVARVYEPTIQNTEDVLQKPTKVEVKTGYTPSYMDRKKTFFNPTPNLYWGEQYNSHDFVPICITAVSLGTIFLAYLFCGVIT